MTEGIIQQVISSFVGRHKYKGYSWTIDDADIKELQQELIESIKETFPVTKPFMHIYNAKTVQQRLIGDNTN